MTFPAPYLARRLLPLVFLLLLCRPVGAEDLSGRVEWIYDGDTIKVVNVGKVRLIGIDAPERESSPKDSYYMRQGISRKTLRSFAARATRFNIQHAKNRVVRLESTRRKRDDYGRLLAFVYLPDGSLLNRLLVENGLAAVYRRFDFPYKESFLAAEQEAREVGKGLWKNATASP
jgi:micrococcal nuclease